MLLEKIKTPSLSHLSYILGSGGKAAIIDPRRDCDIYVEKARSEGLEITHIFEIHRNEDLISGAPILAAMTGAQVLHGPDTTGEVVYANTVREGERFEIGQLVIEVLETPVHTDDHIAYALYDTDYPDRPVGVFKGDALFAGAVGRTDFYPDRKEEVAGQLYDSLRKITSLGDQAIIYPARGAGSVCGSGMADREIFTVGHELRNNPRLQISDRDEFIRVKVAENHYQPPYFRLMERLNIEGGTAVPRVACPRILSFAEVKDCGADHLIDVREPMAYASGHFLGAMSLPVDMISAFAGWFVSEDQRIALVASDERQLTTAMEHLVRISLDNVVGGYTGVVTAAAKGEEMRTIPMIGTQEIDRRLKEGSENWILLDVRDADERASTAIEGSSHIYVGQLKKSGKVWTRISATRSCVPVVCVRQWPRDGLRAGASKNSIFILVRWVLGTVRILRANDPRAESLSIHFRS